MNFKTAVLSQKGGKKNNEDYCAYSQMKEIGCWVVADGLGGHHGGELASKTVVDSILKAFQEQPEFNIIALKSYLEKAQLDLLKLQKNNPLFATMRTTVVVLLANDASALWAHIGDSRLYHFRAGQIIYQTSDHSVPQLMAKAGEIPVSKIRFHEDRNRLLRSLGKEGKNIFEIKEEKISIQAGDIFLLCTDGFWEYITEAEMEKKLIGKENPESWVKGMETQILKKVKEDHDNYSAIAVFLIK